MISITEEEKIGAKVSLAILLVGMLALILILTVMTGGLVHLIYFPFDYSLFVLLFGTIFWGSRAGSQIIKKNKNDDWTGIKTAFLILITFIVSRIPLDMDFRNALDDIWTFSRFLLGLFWVIGTMAIPAIIYGILIGRGIKRYAR
ncbi:MAG: hypothetical protein HYZ44_14555 [Bacteroidetes bacterium]|nr:hypothetical protein [Bacteroidota bacterium]